MPPPLQQVSFLLDIVLLLLLHHHFSCCGSLWRMSTLLTSHLLEFLSFFFCYFLPTNGKKGRCFQQQHIITWRDSNSFIKNRWKTYFSLFSALFLSMIRVIDSVLRVLNRDRGFTFLDIKLFNLALCWTVEMCWAYSFKPMEEALHAWQSWKESLPNTDSSSLWCSMLCICSCAACFKYQLRHKMQ